MAILRLRDNNGNIIEIPAIRGPKGADGTMVFSDLTEEQKLSLKGEKGDQGPQGEKGDKGDQGEKGEKGDKGNRGDDYTLTSEDKIEIADIVIARLPKYNGEVESI